MAQAVLAGAFDGWLIALLCRLLRATEGRTARFLMIYVVTYLVVALTLYHLVIGSLEVLLGTFAGAPVTWLDWLTRFLFPAVTGNTFGAIVFVTGLQSFLARSAN